MLSLQEGSFEGHLWFGAYQCQTVPSRGGAGETVDGQNEAAETAGRMPCQKRTHRDNEIGAFPEL